MKISPLPENEKERLEAILSYHILDTEDELDFDGIVELASQLCDTPISLITLIDERRQWFKAKKGLDIKETHRNLSFCAHAIHKNDVMVVCDTLQDERFFDNPLVTGDPYIRFYAGMPLITSEGYKLGTLAVLDRKPNDLNEQQLKDLRILGKQVVNLLERRMTISRLHEMNKEIACLVEEKTAEIRNVFERVSDAFVALDKNWCYTYVNAKAEKIFNKPHGYLIGKHIWTEFPEGMGQPFHKMYEEAMATQEYKYLEEYYPPYNRWFENHIYPSPSGLSIYFHDITERKKAELARRISEEQKQLIVNASLDAIICFDVSGVITVWNPQAEKIFGWKEHEILGEHLVDTIIPEQYRNQHEKGLKHYLATGEGTVLNRIIELTALNRGHQEFPIELTIAPIKQDGTEFFCAFIRDITERKKMETDLRKSEMYLRGILDSTNDGILAIDNHGKVINSNNRFAELLHIPQELIKEKDDKALLSYVLDQLVNSEGFISKVQELYKSAKTDLDTLHFKDGRIFELYSTPLVLNKRIVGRVWSFRNITERENAERELAESENRLRTIIQTEPECIKLLGANCELLEMNPAGLAMIEAETAERVIGHSLLGLVDPKHREAFANLTNDVFIGKSGMIEFEMTGLKGSRLWMETHAVPLRNTEGKIISLLAISRNITARKENEASLRHAEERYRTIFENAQEGIYQSTPDGHFITANPSLAIMFGYSSAEELIASVFDIGAQLYANPQDRLYMKNLLQKEGKAYGVEFTGLKKNKEIISLRNHVRAIYDNEGNIKYFEGTIDDITERKMTEEKLKIQFAELQKTNYELDRFVYSVSHDLRAPLASILGLINVAEMEKPSPSFKNYLALIRNSINRLDGFIKDILDYSRNSRMDVRIEKINFRDLITETQNNLKLMSGAQRLKITAQIKDNVAFYADSTRIGILLSNLFSNSIKYQDFRKEASFLHLSIVTSSKKATIIVKDNGIGISEKHVTKIFDMFYRASENSKGSGLGLYIAKETITKLGGTIKVQSEFGISTTFEITIPNSTPN